MEMEAERTKKQKLGWGVKAQFSGGHNTGEYLHGSNTTSTSHMVAAVVDGDHFKIRLNVLVPAVVERLQKVLYSAFIMVVQVRH